VFCGADSSDIAGTLKANVTGVLIKRTFAPTMGGPKSYSPRTARGNIIRPSEAHVATT